MRTIVVTGADGFIGRNLVLRLEEDLADVEVVGVDLEDTPESTRTKLGSADLVYHLAGSNRPKRVDEFYEVNEGFTGEVVRALVEQDNRVPVVLASSTQAERDNDYGRSKKAAEEVLERYARTQGGTAIIYRLTNVFGKWSRPNYNSVVATFCHRIARDLSIEIHDPQTRLRLVHVDDVVEAFLDHARSELQPRVHRPEVRPSYEVTLQELADRLRLFRSIRQSLELPDLSDRFSRLLHSVYLSFLPKDRFSYSLQERTDERGKLAELLKGEHFGQIFVSTTRPGVTRGNHYHHTKVEKFCVLSGEAVIRFRLLDGEEVLEYPVSGSRLEVVDIPPGYTHNIENVGDGDMVVLFWASEPFDPDRPDTRYLEVSS